MKNNTPPDHVSVQVAESVHRQAMEFAEAAFLAKLNGDSQKEQEYNLQALEKEREAANAIDRHYDLEPSRSVFYRSAATLAFRCNQLREAERLAACALSSEYVPSEIAQELRELLDDINCHRHHELHGITLHPNELQFSMEGPAIGHGFAQVSLVKSRVEKISSLLDQTMSRLLNPSIDHSILRSQSHDGLIYLSAPVAASYAINFRVGTMQLSLPEIEQSVPSVELSARVIDEFLTCIEFVDKRDVENLRQKISNDAYSRKFLSLVKEIAPDGKNIHSIGFTTPDGDRERTITFSTPRANLKDLAIADSTISSNDNIEICGVLLEANATKQKSGSIQVIDDSKDKYTIQVPREKMSEMVREMFGNPVTVTAKITDNKHVLVDVDHANE